MAIYDYLPTFAEFEPNNLKGLQSGFVVAQMNVSTECTLLTEIGPEGNKVKVLENGHICTIGADGVENWAAGKPMFIHFSEELNTLRNSNRYYALNVAEECPRLVQLIPGDEWMSTIDFENDVKYKDIKAELVKHIVEIKPDKADIHGQWYAHDAMPSGAKGHHYMYIG